MLFYTEAQLKAHSSGVIYLYPFDYYIGIYRVCLYIRFLLV